MSHLSGDQLLDLVDGSLDATAESWARGHLAGCRPCACLYRSQREVRATLKVTPAPAPDAALMAGLMSLSTGNRLGSGALFPTPSPLSGSVDAPAPRLSAIPEEAGERRPDTARWMFTAALASGVSLAALGGASAAYAGTPMSSAKMVMMGISGQSWGVVSSGDDDSPRQGR